MSKQEIFSVSESLFHTLSNERRLHNISNVHNRINRGTF